MLSSSNTELFQAVMTFPDEAKAEVDILGQYYKTYDDIERWNEKIYNDVFSKNAATVREVYSEIELISLRCENTHKVIELLERLQSLFRIPQDISNTLEATSFVTPDRDAVATAVEALVKLRHHTESVLEEGRKIGEEFESLQMTKDFLANVTALREGCARSVQFSVKRLLNQYTFKQAENIATGAPFQNADALLSSLEIFIPLIEELGETSNSLADVYLTTIGPSRTKYLNNVLGTVLKTIEIKVSPELKRRGTPIPTDDLNLMFSNDRQSLNIFIEKNTMVADQDRTPIWGLFQVIKGVIEATRDDERAISTIFKQEKATSDFAAIALKHADTLVTFTVDVIKRTKPVGLISLCRAISLSINSICVCSEFAEYPILRDTIVEKLRASNNICAQQFRIFTESFKPKIESLPTSIYRIAIPEYAIKCAALLGWCLDAAVRKYTLDFVSHEALGKVAQDCVPFETNSPVTMAIDAVKQILTFSPKESAQRDPKHGEKYLQAHIIQCLFPGIFVLGPEAALPPSLITVSCSDVRQTDAVSQPPVGALLSLFHDAVSKYAENQFVSSQTPLAKFLHFSDAVKAQLDRGDHPDSIRLLEHLSTERLKKIANAVSIASITKFAKEIWDRIERQFPINELEETPLMNAIHADLISQVWTSICEYLYTKYNDSIILLESCYGSPGTEGRWNIIRAAVAGEAFRTKKEPRH